MTGARTSPSRWLLFFHRIPPKPDYLRVKVGRRLQRVGAVAVKNAVYVLPASEQSAEDFHWIRKEIVDGGGDASTCRAEFIDGLSDAEIERLFHDARSRDFEEIARSARKALVAARSIAGRRADRSLEHPRLENDLARLHKRFAAAVRIDFFETPARREAHEALEALSAALRPEASALAPTGASRSGPDQFQGRTWVTREGIFVDRIASAWLIARFIDRDALIKFVAPKGYRPAAAELRFDMFPAEFTHEGDRCTFETLLARFNLTDPALQALGEIVHEIDLKDAKFERPEAAGIERVLAAIGTTHPDDLARLARGRQVFDELYALLAVTLAP